MKLSEHPTCDAETLLRLVRDKDKTALDQITRCYGTHLLSVGRKQCGDGLAEDAVQDALVSAATHLDDFRSEGSLEGWLSRMVTNACRHMQRGRKSDPALHEEFMDDVLDEKAEVAAEPESLVAIQDLGEELIAALHTLQSQDRAIVLLAEVNGWKGPEIAKALNMSPSQVRTRLSRSRASLRSELTTAWQDWGIEKTHQNNPLDE